MASLGGAPFAKKAEGREDKEVLDRPLYEYVRIHFSASQNIAQPLRIRFENQA